MTAECCDISVPDELDNQWQNQDDELADLAKAFAHPARVQIIRFLLDQDEKACICGDICQQIPLAQSTVSQHLKILKRAGLIYGRVDGPRICYYIDRSRMVRFKELIAKL